ncbi:hypothetical protein, partial [Bosea thiooxidans]|uniref:hypothetical protein n=1 Tax=Bosea thiooxidans TaxID=53254 RepID=UPI000A68557F
RNTPHENDLDPIAVLTAAINDDPSLAELAAFRACKPDLKAAARECKRLHDESLRIRFSELENRWQVTAGLTLASLSYMAAVCIWPTDSLDEADAKLALCEATRIHGDRQEPDYVVALENALARRIRVQRAAFSVGELMVPPAPQAPGPEARGLASWPLQRLDLKTMLPARGGPPNFADREVERWSGLLAEAPDLDYLAGRVEHLFATADRLLALAQRDGENSVELRRASEGALLMSYLLAARVAIWPVAKGSGGVKAKRRVVALIDARASRRDPLHAQAAIRHLFEEASWLAKLLGPDRMATNIPSWTEIV